MGFSVEFPSDQEDEDMISAASRFGPQGTWGQAPRRPSCTGMGHQALLTEFVEELRKQQAKSCERDVDRLGKAGMSDRLAGKREAKTEEGKFVF